MLASSCAHARAQGPIDTPRLDVPPPPPRVVEPEPEPPAPAAAPGEPARPAPARPPVRREPVKPEPSRPEPPRAEPEPRADEPARPPVTLQTTPTRAEAELERAIRATLGAATADLARVDVRALNPDARSQYDTARRFVVQADDAVRARNLVFAKSLAEKAAALAAQLAGK